MVRLRTIKPFNDEGFKFIKVIEKSTRTKTGTVLVECPKCKSPRTVRINSYYRNRIRCSCEIHHKRLYSIYTNMKTRCYNTNAPGYKWYGGRGIKICDKWLQDYGAFQRWAMSNGYSDDLTIDRVDVNGDYCPSNCRWVTIAVQERNKTNTIRISGTSLRKWCIDHGINYKTVHTYKTRHPRCCIEEVVNKYIKLEENKK